MAVKEFDERQDRFNVFNNHEEKDVRLDPPLAHNLLCLYEAAKQTNGDVVIIIDGEEGSGKSTLGRQIAKFLDPNFTEKSMEFNPEDAIKAHFRGLPDNWASFYKEYKEGKLEAKPWECIILDESADLDRKRTMSAGSVEFTSFMTQSRQLHKIFIIILPSIHILNGYIAEHRAVALIHAYKHEKTEMGFYRWYGRKAIREMFSPMMHRQKLYSKNKLFAGRFSGREAFDITYYTKKKAKALDRYRKIETMPAMDPDALIAADRRMIMKTFLELGYDNDKRIYTLLRMPRRSWEEIKKAVKKDLGIVAEPRGSKKRALELMENMENESTDGLDDVSTA